MTVAILSTASAPGCGIGALWGGKTEAVVGRGSNLVASAARATALHIR